MYAAEQGHLEIVKTLVEEGRADINTTEHVRIK